VEAIPEGRVASYGRVAALAGLPAHARFVGYALGRLPPESAVPWHRVVGSGGRISARNDDHGQWLQRRLLEGEGIEFSAGRIAMDRFGWTGTDENA